MSLPKVIILLILIVQSLGMYTFVRLQSIPNPPKPHRAIDRIIGIALLVNIVVVLLVLLHLD